MHHFKGENTEIFPAPSPDPTPVGAFGASIRSNPLQTTFLATGLLVVMRDQGVIEVEQGIGRDDAVCI